MNKSKETSWSQEEISKLKLALQLYHNLNKEMCEHIHLHVLPYKSANEILKKSNEIFKEEDELKSNCKKTTSPVLRSTLSPTTSPVLKSTLSVPNKNNNNNNNNINRSVSPEFWSNN